MGAMSELHADYEASRRFFEDPALNVELDLHAMDVCIGRLRQLAKVSPEHVFAYREELSDLSEQFNRLARGELNRGMS